MKNKQGSWTTHHKCDDTTHMEYLDKTLTFVSCIRPQIRRLQMYPRQDPQGVCQAGGGQDELWGGQVVKAGDIRGCQLLGHHRPDQVELEEERVSGTQPRGQLVHMHVGSSQPGSWGMILGIVSFEGRSTLEGVWSLVYFYFRKIVTKMCDFMLPGGLWQYGIELRGHRRGLCAEGQLWLAVESQQF